MSVVSGERTIFCEGKQSSLDYELLQRVVEGLSGDRCTIIPAGSKFTFSIFAEGYFFPDTWRNQPSIVFRDRDFDVEPSTDAKLLTLGNRLGNRLITLTYRACVENYLLDACLIHQYWSEKSEEKRDNPTSKWGHGESPGIEKIVDWIETSAKNLRDYQAVRWALGSLLRASAAREQLKKTWTGGSGKLPVSLAFESCRIEALALISQFRQAVVLVDSAAFEDRLADYQQRFTQNDFWAQRQYLIWFHGKDLQKEMQRQQSRYISLSSFFNWAVT